MKLLTQNTKRSRIIGFVSQFGNGKTFFLQYLYCEVFNNINDSENYPIYIDISKFEHAKNELFITILLELLYQFDVLKNSDKEGLSNVINQFKKIIPKALKAISIGTLGALTKGNESLISAIGEISEEFGLQLRDSVSKEGEYLTKLKKCIEDDQNKSYLIIIDNLDRCRPEFVLEVLVVLKRLFNIKRMTFLLSYDKRQIINLLQTLYGKNVDIQSYIRKYISFEYYMPQYTREIQQFTLAKIDKKTNDIEEDLISKFKNMNFSFDEMKNFLDDKIRNDETIKNRLLLAYIWQFMFMNTSLSLRKYQQGFVHINLIKTELGNNLKKYVRYIELLYIKLNFPIEYQSFHYLSDDVLTHYKFEKEFIDTVRELDDKLNLQWTEQKGENEVDENKTKFDILHNELAEVFKILEGHFNDV